MTTGKAVLGILAGTAIGAGLGILFAPDSGCNTRKKISEKNPDANYRYIDFDCSDLLWLYQNK